MRRVYKCALAMLALCTGLSTSPAHSFPVTWDINPSLSSFTLTVPDQSVTLGTITATMRLRNQNNAAWTTNTAPVDGLLATDLGLGFSTVQFLGGASSLVGVNSGNYRPNPASYSTSTTSTINTAGTFTNTSSAPGVFAARVNATVPALFGATINVGYISFDNVSYDVSSIVTAMAGTSFLSNAITLGLADSRINFDGITGGLIPQVVGDTQAQSGPLLGVNTGGPAGSIVNVGGIQYRITVPINLPVTVSLGGVNLTATATGTVVGFAFIPEPATAALVVAGIVALGVRGRRRRLDS